MIEKDDPLRLRIEVLRVLARTNERNRAVLIERNIEDYLKTAGSEKRSLERLRDVSTAKMPRDVKVTIGA